MKLRYLDARHLDWLEQYTYKITRVDDIFKGFASHVNIKSTKRVVSFIHEGTPVIYGARDTNGSFSCRRMTTGA